jgi:hypothetical protein
MKSYLAVLLLILGPAPLIRAEIQTDWAFHSSGAGSRLVESVPGKDFPFVEGGSDEVDNDQTVRLYVLTAQQFAGDKEEQVFVRWWDGAMAHWIMGTWVENLALKADAPGTRFRDQPAEGAVTVDLWKIEIPPWITRPGENFYAIQLKAYSLETSDERFLLSRPGGDFTRTNNLGQIWSASEEFDGQDWRINVWENPLRNSGPAE